MLIIKTFLKEVPGKGIGLFAGDDLAEGQVWWIWDQEMDMIIGEKQYSEMSEVKRSFVKKYSVKSETGDYWLYTDKARFCNHADEPNSIGFDEKSGVSTRIKTIKPVKIGEELPLDYREFIYDFPDGVLNFEVR